MRSHVRLLAFSGTLLLAACNGISTACTLIGCESGLTVQLAGPVQGGAYTVELRVPGRAPLVRECATDAACGGTFFFPDVRAEEVTVRVTAGAQSHERTLRPTYVTTRPNGPGCGPTCVQGTATVQLPG